MEPPSFAALARAIIKDLREIKEAIQKQGSASSKGQQQPDPEIIVRTAHNDKLKVETQPNDPKGQATQTGIKWGTWAAVIAASIYAWISACTLREVRKQTEMARGNWVNEQRAYVIVNGVDVRAINDASGKQFFWRVSPLVMNTGNTPTRNLAWTEAVHDWDLTPNIQNPRQPLEEDLTQVTLNHAMIGPHQEIKDLMHESIPVQYTESIFTQKIRVFIHGALVYQDLPSGGYHVTRFCYLLYGQAGVEHPREFYSTQCGGKTNCMDGECNPETQHQLEALRARPN